MIKFSFAPVLCLALLFSGCAEKKQTQQQPTDEELRTRADELAHRFIITDGHIDLPDYLRNRNFRFNRKSVNLLISTTDGEFDYTRAKIGGLDAPFMSIYIPAAFQLRPDKGKVLADTLINMVENIVKYHSDKFALAVSVEEVQKNFKDGKISLPMGMENGAPIGNDLKNVQYFYDRGIRYITLTHNQDNQICDSSRDTTHTWNGLSPFGKKVVQEMNRVGIMIDISHVDDSTFYQVMKLSKAPCIASHSSCRVFAPTVKRDMTDDMIIKLGENGGVMQINFFNAFLDSSIVRQNSSNQEKLNALLAGKNLKSTDSLAKPIIEQFKKENPIVNIDTEMVVNHIDHVVKLAGIDHVAFGSDFDGVEGNLPEGLKDVAQFPNLIYILLKRGYSEADIEKICSGNLFRVWKQVAEVAAQK